MNSPRFSTQPLDAAERNPFHRILTALGLEDTSSWTDAADHLDVLVERADDDASLARVLEKEVDALRCELQELRLLAAAGNDKEAL